jgi:uncharacterized protein (AIM24 family)
MSEKFLQNHKPTDDTKFQLETSKIMSARVDGSMTAKAGTMVAYDGELSFTGKASAEGGIKGLVKEMATSESSPVMEIEGSGRVYLADQEKEIQLIKLDKNDEITVNGEDVLAFENTVNYEIQTMDGLSGVSSGGLINVFLSGPGVVAVTTYGEPKVLEPPVKTDPDATVAWSGNLTPSGNVDTGLKDVVGQSSGETFQLDFNGDSGFVIIQSREESGMQ